MDMLRCIHVPYGGKRMTTDTAGTVHHEDQSIIAVVRRRKKKLKQTCDLH
jgi:hypothetical protein